MNPAERTAAVRLLGDLVWHLEKLGRAAARLEERLDLLVWRARCGLASHREDVSHSSPKRPPKPSCRRRAADANPVEWLSSLKTERRPDGSLVVFVNSHRPFVLQPHLGALLLALAEDTGVGDDEGVGFKTVGDLAIRMAKRLGTRRLPSDTINKYVCKLRKELCRRTGLGAGVIQTNRRLGRRLALRRPTSSSGPGERHGARQPGKPFCDASRQADA
jgi:hypothetical protein